MRKYVGARGLGVKYVLDNGPQVEPFSPDNLLCVMTGPLSGTEVKMSGRLCVVTKSPLTGTVTDSHMGGWTAAKLKWAGLDGLLFKGKSDAPVYAYVEDGKVTLYDAETVWGMETGDTVRYLQPEHGDDCAVMCIGPGRREAGALCRLDQRERARGRPRRHRRSRGLQEPQSHRDQGRQEEPAQALRSCRFQGSRQEGAGRHHERSRDHRPAQGRSQRLRHQRADEHGQRRRRSAD